MTAPGGMEFGLVSHAAREAFSREIMPYIQDLSIFTRKDLDQAYFYLKDTVFPNARKQMDHQTYARLIRYKTIDSSDDQFFNNLDSILTSWYERAKQRMEGTNRAEASPL